MVSVIIPVYNGEKFIQDAIESVLAQTYKDYEIIVVNDGSTDNTEEVLKPYIDKRLIRYFYQENKGVSAARNKGIREARGEYIAFLDADDVWVDVHLQNSVDALFSHPEAGLSFSDVRYWGESSDLEVANMTYENSISDFLTNAFTRLNDDVDISNEKLMGYLLGIGVPIRISTALIRREYLIANNICFNELVNYTEESQFLIEFSYFSKFLHLRRQTVFMRRTEAHVNDKKYKNKIVISYIYRIVELEDFFIDKTLSQYEKDMLSKRISEMQDVIFRHFIRNPLDIRCAGYVLQGKKFKIFLLWLYERLSKKLCPK